MQGYLLLGLLYVVHSNFCLIGQNNVSDQADKSKGTEEDLDK